MSLGDFIEKIQNKPRHVRVQILWVSVLVVMFFVVSGWVISLKQSLSLNEGKDEVQSTAEFSKVPSLIESFRASIGSFFEKSKEGLLNATENNSAAPEDEIQNNAVELEKNEAKTQPAVLPLSQ